MGTGARRASLQIANAQHLRLYSANQSCVFRLSESAVPSHDLVSESENGQTLHVFAKHQFHAAGSSRLADYMGTVPASFLSGNVIFDAMLSIGSVVAFL